jgi:hypothetical protein
MPITINNVIVPSVQTPVTGTGASGSPFTISDNAITSAKLQDVAGLTPGVYTNATVTVNAKGQVTAISAGAAGGAIQRATLSASGETTMKLTHTGASAPTLTKDATGIYRLNVPSGTEVLSANWQANNTNVDISGAITLIVDSAAGNELFANIQFYGLGNNDIANLFTLGIIIDQTIAVAGEVTITMPNVNGFGASGFRALLRF